MQHIGVSAIHPNAPEFLSAAALFSQPTDLDDAIDRLNTMWRVGAAPQWADVDEENAGLMHFQLHGVTVMLSQVNEPLVPEKGALPDHSHYIAITLYTPATPSQDDDATLSHGKGDGEGTLLSHGEGAVNAATESATPDAAANPPSSRPEVERRRHALTAHIILTQLSHALLQAPGAIGLYRAELGVLQPPEMLNELAPLLGQGTIPLPLWINIRLQTHDLTVGRTLGLPLFGHLDVEVLESTHSAESVYSELANIASYIITSDNYLLPSQTISVADGEQIPVTQSISPLDKSPVIRIMY